MSDERREIALRALRAAGHDQAAELVEAIIPAEPTAAPAPVVAPATPPPAQGAEPPAFTMAAYDEMSESEQKAFALTDEGDAAITAALRREG
jgi:hypothetical protein